MTGQITIRNVVDELKASACALESVSAALGIDIGLADVRSLYALRIKAMDFIRDIPDVGIALTNAFSIPVVAAALDEHDDDDDDDDEADDEDKAIAEADAAAPGGPQDAQDAPNADNAFYDAMHAMHAMHASAQRLERLERLAVASSVMNVMLTTVSLITAAWIAH